MTILVVGASGATGKLLAEQLLNQGHYVKVIVRSVDKLPVPDQFMTYYDVFIRKDYESAILASEKMAKSDPLNIESHWHFGLMRYFSGRYDKSLSSFNTTLELDPQL